jgi:GWxTD domain-containing protein
MHDSVCRRRAASRCGGLAIWLLLPLSLSAQWTLAVKNRPAGRTNTVVYLAYAAPSDKAKDFQADISFRPAGTNRTYLRKQTRLRTSGPRTFSVAVQLPEGEYEVDVDLFDPDGPSRINLALPEPYRINSSRAVRISDIILSYESDPLAAFSQPIADPRYLPEKRTAYYYLEFAAPDYSVLTIRSVLYKAKATERQVRETTSAYESLRQSNRIAALSGSTPFMLRDTLPLQALDEGEYMVHMLLYHDVQLLAEEKVRFTVGGNIRDRVFADLETSIRMMEYILPEDRLNYLLELEDPYVVRTEFLNAWKQLYPQETDRMMEAYYRKVFEAGQRFAEDLPGWQTDRGRIFIQYGEPREREVLIGGSSYLRWTYARWSLSFLFERQGSRQVLVR